MVKIDESIVSRIPARIHDWKSPLVWHLAAVDVQGIERRIDPLPPVLLSCNFLDESWQAKEGGEDATARLNPNRASFLLTTLEQLRATRWLGPEDTAAVAALAKPSLVIQVLCRVATDAGDETMVRRELLVAPVANSPDNRFFFARVSGDPDFFILDRDAVRNLSVKVFDD